MLESLLQNFHFLRPLWLLAALPTIWLAFSWARARVGRTRWRGQIDPELLAVLLEPTSGRDVGRARWVPVLFMALLGLALAGPSWERKPQPVAQSNEALVVLLDLSLSMYVQDVKPSRLVRARQEITDILRERTEGFTGLIAYAGDAHTVAPLTDDTATIENLLSSLSPAMMPIPGSNVDHALELAQELHANAGMQQGQILIVTDAVDNISDVTKHRSNRFPISILGIGTPDGGPIPLDFANQPGRHLQTNDGDIIVPKLDEARLEKIAQATGGNYHTAAVGDADIHRVTQHDGLNPATRESEREFDLWFDRGYWLALAALPLLLLSFRRGFVFTPNLWLPATLIAGLVVPGPEAHAGFWEDLWQRKDQQGYVQLREGEPELAAATFADPDWTAAANYRSGNYTDAAEHYRNTPAPEARYNLGNTLAHLGDYQRAIATYEQVLADDPAHEDARFNKELLEKLLAEQQQASDQDNDEQQDQGGEQGENQRDQQQQGNSEQQQGEQPEQDQQEKEQQEQAQDQTAQAEQGEGEEQQTAAQERNEDTDALEQWLRRVPDDPGGLLQRKFQYEYKQRLRQGEYRARNVDKPW